MDSSLRTPPSVFAQLAVIAGCWVFLYILNDWLFDNVAVSQYASWVFLPAALRMLAVLLCGWTGVLGLFIGSFITALYTHNFTDPGMVIVLAGLSALAPMVAYVACARLFGLRTDLQGLSAVQLVILSVAAALVGSILHNLHFSAIGISHAFGHTFVTMFVGDLIGTFAMLYAAKYLMGILLTRKSPVA
ncbi:hypothetical protein [Orrella daihaiensis]|uniref:MASE1 protein n=1 Tax=Orrella daihaiensis TaxID=2782176 RepID=A0ABY4AHB3_9BURK|nr:hypothetical protein [Orrella daihaiensis]UOD49682.1 hypothetical protein DHf2319_09445 [Orrella daihaiensis]